MPKNPPDDMPQITPYLYYNDVGSALEWLEKTFGLKKRFELPAPDGKIMHAEMALGSGVVMMGQACEEQGGRSPAELPAVSQSLYVYVDDVDAHHAHAKAAGAPDIGEPVDMFWGDRLYDVKDLEGHRWAFAQHTKDVAPEDLHPPGM